MSCGLKLPNVFTVKRNNNNKNQYISLTVNNDKSSFGYFRQIKQGYRRKNAMASIKRQKKEITGVQELKPKE